MNKKWNKNLLFLFIPLMIILGKIIRWTVLKSVLVDMSIGNGMIVNIVNGNTCFSMLSKASGADPTGNSVALFSLINFLNLKTTVEFEIFITVVWNFILILLISKSKKTFNTLEFMFLIVSVAVLNIWDFCLAKEPVQMLFFLFIALVLMSNKLSNKNKYILTIFIILLSVLFYRIYYILIIGFFVVVYLICEKFLLKTNKINKKTVFKLLIILAFVYFIMLNIIKGIDIASYDELIRVRTRSGQAHTQMVNIFKSTNLVLFSIDYFIMIIRMMFPIELLIMGVKYIPYVFYQILVSYFMINNFVSIKKISATKKIAVYLYIAFLLASATFEPDFGSWVRHEAATIPVLLILSNVIEVKDKEVLLDEKNNN